MKSFSVLWLPTYSNKIIWTEAFIFIGLFNLLTKRQIGKSSITLLNNLNQLKCHYQELNTNGSLR
jgi:hypothetical protein